MNDLVNSIADGTAQLLSAEEICKRLSISRSTFDRWVRNSAPVSDFVKNMQSQARGIGPYPRDSNDDSRLSFPQPDIRIGNSPRWELTTFKAWLAKNLVAGA